MSYVGNPLATAFASREKQDLTGQSGTSFTLTHAVSSPNDLSVYINHVRQEPTTAYTVNGTALTTTGSVAGTDDFYIIYDELAVQSISHPTNQALTATAGTFTSGLVGTTATFSGAVSGTNGTFSGNVSGTLTTAAQPNITSTGTLTSATISGDLTVDTNTLFVDASENKVGIGTTTPRNTLDFGVTSNNDHIIALRDNNTSRTILGLTNGYGVRVGSPHDGTNSENMFEVGEIAGDGTTYQNTHFAVTYGGNATINNGNLVIGTNGKGIDFSAQSPTSTGDGTQNPTTEGEVLKNYEHGYFYPKVVASGVTFDYQHSGGQYGYGHYTRIGDIVFIDINLDSDGGCSGSTGNSVSITNMPFSNNTGGSLNVQYFYRRVSSSSYPHQMCSIWGTSIGFLRSPNSGQWASLPASDINFADHRMKISGCYHIG